MLNVQTKNSDLSSICLRLCFRLVCVFHYLENGSLFANSFLLITSILSAGQIVQMCIQFLVIFFIELIKINRNETNNLNVNFLLIVFMCKPMD